MGEQPGAAEGEPADLDEVEEARQAGVEGGGVGAGGERCEGGGKVVVVVGWRLEDAGGEELRRWGRRGRGR